MSEKRVLIVRIGAMGDVLHTLPAVAALRRERPKWRIDWVIDPRWAPTLVDSEGCGPIVNHAHLASPKKWADAPFSRETIRAIVGLRRALRAEHYDLAVDLQGAVRSAWIARFAKAPDLVGDSKPREPVAVPLYKRTVVRHGVHVVEQATSLLGEACGLALKPAPVEMPQEEWADTWAAELAGEQRVCMLAASAGWGAKQWPAEQYGALARELRSMGYRVVVNAPREDDEVAAGVVEASGGAAQIAVCNVTGLIALIRRTSLLIGGDSGPTHLAALLGVPLVALYGPTDPARNGPWGDGPMRVLRDESSVTSHKRVKDVEAGLARISVEDVMKAVRSVISDPAGEADSLRE